MADTRISRSKVVDLLTAISDALTVPWPANYSDTERRTELLRERVAYIQGAINAAESGTPLDITIAGLRKAVTDTLPVTYPVAEEKTDGETR